MRVFLSTAALAAALLLPAVAAAQTPGSTPAPRPRAVMRSTYYIEIQGQPYARSMDVSLRVGKLFQEMTQLSGSDLQRLTAPRRYNSMVDAMNSLAARGWRLVDCYTLPVGAQTAVYWVVAKDVEHPMDLLDGLLD